jgi:transglutaminase-like putative cysteine protease
MSSATKSDRGPSDGVADRLRLAEFEVPYHWLAVGSVAVLMATYVSVLYHVTDVVGGTTTLLVLVTGTLLAGTTFARRLRPLHAAVLGTGLLALGLVGYYLSVPSAYVVAMSLGKVVADNVALLTGLSVLRMTEVGTWALGVAPALVFGPWYLVLRRRYALAAATGGAALGFFVLTGDAGTFATLIGSLAGVATLGFGTLARRGGTPAQVDTIVVVLVAMVLVTSSVSIVPGGAASPILPGGGGGAPTVEQAFVDNGDRVSIVGSIRLSPETRFSVEANESAYWRVGAYDRYDGDGWIRTGDARDYREQAGPPGRSKTVEQTVVVEAKRASAMPTAWKPTRLTSGDEDNVRITSLGSFDPVGALREGERYSVVSEVPDPATSELRDAERDYPDRIEERYLQLPESSSDRIRQRTDEITANADTPYATAVAVERWLEANKEYSLTVDRPEGDIAESFIFDMEQGYCTYYATSMVAMLRSQDIPARFAVGYTSGQQVAEDEWVVRGLDSHAWVEVYFPDVGWVKFDPTPAGPRQDAENSRVEQARESNVSNVDTDASEAGTWTPTTTETTTQAGNETVGTAGNLTVGPNERPNGPQLDPGDSFGETSGEFTTTDDLTADGAVDSGGDEGGGLPIGPPSREESALGLLVGLGLVAAARQTGLLARLRRAVWLRWQPRNDPETDVTRAFDRLEHLLAAEYSERRPGETPREYLDRLAARGELDHRIEQVASIYERVRYAGDGDDGLADEAVSLVDELVRERRGLLQKR